MVQWTCKERAETETSTHVDKFVETTAITSAAHTDEWWSLEMQYQESGKANVLSGEGILNYVSERLQESLEQEQQQIERQSGAEDRLAHIRETELLLQHDPALAGFTAEV